MIHNTIAEIYILMTNVIEKIWDKIKGTFNTSIQLIPIHTKIEETWDALVENDKYVYVSLAIIMMIGIIMN